VRDSITLITLKGHSVSEQEGKKLAFWFADHPMVWFSTVEVATRQDMYLAKKEHKFSDLPCAVYQEAGSKKKERLYSADFEELTRKLRKRWAKVKRR